MGAPTADLHHVDVALELRDREMQLLEKRRQGSPSWLEM